MPKIMLISWFIMVFIALLFWNEPLKLALWFVISIFAYKVTKMQGDCATFFVAGQIHSLPETIYAIALFAILFLLLISVIVGRALYRFDK